MNVSRRCLAERFEFLVVLASLCVVAVVGCSKPESAVIVCAKVPVPPEADVAVRNVLAGLQRKDLRALWEFLPPSYQADVQELLHDFGQRLDEKSWEPFVTTCRKARLVTQQMTRRLGESGDAANDSDRELVAKLRDVEQFLKVVCDSELSDVARLNNLDAFRFLGGTGNQLVEVVTHGTLGDSDLGTDVFSQFGAVKVELLESIGASAVLNVDSAVLNVQWPGQEATQHKFVRVEERWIPQTLVAAWPTEFPKVREQCLAWADDLRANPEPWHARLREFDQLLDELAATKSVAETQQVWQSGASRLIVAWFGVAPRDPPKTEEIPVESPLPTKPARVKRPETEVLLPDEPQK